MPAKKTKEKVPAARKPVKYLTNKELLAEINRCKKTYCYFIDEELHGDFDGIVRDLSEVTPEFINEVCEKKSKAITPRKSDPIPVEPEGLIIRLMTYDHIPLDPDRKRRSRAANQTHAHTCFPPFSHWLVEGFDEETQTYKMKEVGRAFWEGGLENGWFSPLKGRMTERMGRMFQLLVEKYGHRSNWRGYSYNDEMQSLAIVQLAQVGLQFDESKSSNPFAFYTTTITNCFVRLVNVEKKAQSLRDDLLIASGAAPSYTRQVENELARNGNIEPKKLPRKKGRKTAAQLKAEKEANKPIE